MIETIEVHSKNFVIRWVQVSPPSRITWNVWAGKRSISFGIYISGDEINPGHQLAETSGNLVERLDAAGFESLESLHRLESKELTEGSIALDKPKLLAFVFDNSFSIKNNKQVRFSFNIEPITPDLQPVEEDSRLAGGNHQNLAVSAAAAAVGSSNQNQVAYPSTHGAISEQSDEQGEPELVSLRKRSTSRSKASDIASLRPRRRGTGLSANGLNSPELYSHTSKHNGEAAKLRPRGTTISSAHESDPFRSLDGRYITGYLQKKRRKQYQGFARRYFSLNMQTGLLNYYLSSKSSILRGVMPIKISEQKIDKRNSIIHLNSGMEKWALKSSDPTAFEIWCAAFKELRSSGMPDESESESESESMITDSSVAATGELPRRQSVSTSAGEDLSPLPKPDKLASNLPALSQFRSLIVKTPTGRTRQSLETIYKSLLKEGSSLTTKSNKASRPRTIFNRSRLSHATSPLRKKGADFWDLLYHQVSSRNFLGICSVGLLLGALMGIVYSLAFVITLVGATAGGYVRFTRPPVEGAEDYKGFGDEETFTDIYKNSQQNGFDKVNSVGSGSVGSDEDEDDDLSDESGVEEELSGSPSGVAYVPQVPRYSQTPSLAEADEYQKANTPLENPSNAYAGDSKLTESTEVPPSTSGFQNGPGAAGVVSSDAVDPHDSGENEAETSLYPLPHENVERRQSVPSPLHAPPSIIAMLKKAKDLSTASAPVTTNEPLSGVEAVSEMFQYADLLDAASKAPSNSNLRVMLVAVFAVARLSTLRCKERSLRKPFTPLLGETFELVREDYGFRFLAEKVTHKPEVVATQAESPLWTVHFTSRPHTKMWAKSMQLSDTGHLRVTFPDGEGISFINPDLFMRNILAGERYVEPSGVVTVESTADANLNATIEFKAGGIFSGRSEEVKISSGTLVYEGKWTEALYHDSKVVWSAKPLVENPNKHYGWTLFCAQLNEITTIENSHLPPNDSRLRPDLREYESQKDVDKAENIKLSLEQHQRDRRKTFEEAKKLHEPFFFEKTNDAKGHYILKHGSRNYWVKRQNKDWNSIPNFFE